MCSSAKTLSRVLALTRYTHVLVLTLYTRVIALTRYTRVLVLTLYIRVLGLTRYTHVLVLTLYTRVLALTLYTRVLALTRYTRPLRVHLFKHVYWHVRLLYLLGGLYVSLDRMYDLVYHLDQAIMAGLPYVKEERVTQYKVR